VPGGTFGTLNVVAHVDDPGKKKLVRGMALPAGSQVSRISSSPLLGTQRVPEALIVWPGRPEFGPKVARPLSTVKFVVRQIGNPVAPSGIAQTVILCTPGRTVLLLPSYSGTSVGRLNTPVLSMLQLPVVSVIKNDEFGTLVLGRSQ